MQNETGNLKRIPTNVLSNIDRSSFIDLVNGLMRGAVRLDGSLTEMEAILSDPTVFENMSDKYKLDLYRSFMQRHSSVVGGINRVFDVAVRNDFNRNFFGIKSGEGEEQITDESNPEQRGMSKEVSMVLSQIADRINTIENKVSNNQ